MEKVKLFWVECGPHKGLNFGDRMSQVIVRQCTQLPIEYVDVDHVPDANLIAVGSILHLVPQYTTAYIWGSGIIQEDHTFSFPDAHIQAVRGKLTAKRLGVDVPLGDPLLLWETEKRPRYPLGICPHYVDYEDERIWQLAHDDEVLVIDPLARDAPERIATCERILSTSLHGLVIADALGIPNLWTVVSENKIVGHGFKFRDYYSAFGIDDPIPHTLCGNMRENIYRIDANWSPRPLEQVRKDLWESFPQELIG